MTLLLPLPTQMRSHSLLTGVAPSSAAPASSSSIFAVAAAFPSSQLHIPKSSSSSSSSSSLSSFYTTLKLQRTSFLGAWRPSHNKKHGSDNKKQQQQLKMAKSYMEQPKNPLFEFLSKVQGGLPVVGLLSRILSDEGGIGGDRIQFVEFCGRVEKACSSEASRTFFAFQERHGTVARPQYVLIWCWAAAVGAGLLKSEEIMLAALRLRVSYDIQYEIESFNLLMDTAAKLEADELIITRFEKAQAHCMFVLRRGTRLHISFQVNPNEIDVARVPDLPPRSQEEEDVCAILHREALEAKRENSKSPIPDVPVIARAEKALDAICKCCIGPNPITDEDINLLSIILCAVFPTVNKTEIQHILRSKSRDTSKRLVQEESLKTKDKEEMVEDSSNSMAQ